MLSIGNEILPAAGQAISPDEQVKNAERIVELVAFKQLSLLRLRGAAAPRSNARNHARPIDDEPAHSRGRELRPLMIVGLDGDARAYHTLLEQLSDHLRAYYRRRFARVGHGPAEAEDLLQEVLIAIHTHRQTYDPFGLSRLGSHAVARYKFLDYLRRTKASFKDMQMDSAQQLTASSDMSAVESGLDLDRLMSRISSKARQAIQYVKLEGLSISEAAVRCGMSESAVKVAVHRGLKALVSRIGEEGGT